MRERVGRPVRATVAVLVLGLLALVGAAALDREDQPFRFGVTPTRVAVELGAGDVACQTRVDVIGRAAAIGFSAGTYRRPGPALAVWVRGARGVVRARTALPAGYADNATHRLRLDREVRDGTVDVCVRNAGPERVALYGGGAEEAPGSALVTPAGRPPTAIALRFFARDDTSLLAAAPDVARRAALFHPAWMGTWTSWVLLVLVGVGVPGLVLVAVRQAAREDG